MLNIEKLKEDRNKSFTKETYLTKRYLSPARMSSYAAQIKEVEKTSPKTVLEIGIGNGYVAKFLKSKNYNVVTLDNNDELKPNVVASVLGMPFNDSQFDIVVCCEVLEHISFDNFLAALNEIKRVSKTYILLTFPDVSNKNKIDIKLFKRNIISIPITPKKIPDNHSHYWEIGRRGFPIGKIKENIYEAGLKIEKEYAIKDNIYHRLFLLRIKK